MYPAACLGDAVGGPNYLGCGSLQPVWLVSDPSIFRPFHFFGHIFLSKKDLRANIDFDAYLLHPIATAITTIPIFTLNTGHPTKHLRCPEKREQDRSERTGVGRSSRLGEHDHPRLFS